ncbi:F0F1 ATP synthase subunit B family protein [Persephonella sp.]
MKNILLLAVLSFSTAYAGGGEHGGMMLVWKAINTLILVGALYYIIKRWGVQFFENRRKAVTAMVEEAKKAKEESEKALEDAKAKLEEAKMKFTESLKIAEETAKKEREVSLKEANEMAERIKAQAKEAVQVEIKRGENELRRYAVRKALEISEKMIKEKVDSEVEKEIINKTLKALS